MAREDVEERAAYVLFILSHLSPLSLSLNQKTLFLNARENWHSAEMFFVCVCVCREDLVSCKSSSSSSPTLPSSRVQSVTPSARPWRAGENDMATNQRCATGWEVCMCVCACVSVLGWGWGGLHGPRSMAAGL